MINPLDILILTPSKDGRNVNAYTGGIAATASAHLFGNIAFLNSCSHIGLARNAMIHTFLRSPYQWAVFIDDDIGFSSDDFRILCEFPRHGEDWNTTGLNPEHEAVVSKDDDGHALISCAEYSRKIENGDPARFGMGFCRISRQVFERLDKLNNLDGSARVNQFMHMGSLISDYFICGVFSDHNFLPEDVGFFRLCQMAGLIPRIETRTRLDHHGNKVFPYRGPSLGS